MRLTIQLYTLRDALDKDVAGTLKKVRETGLEYVELAGTYGKSISEWKSMLGDLGLKVSGSHIGLDQYENSFDQVISDNQTIGNKNLIVPWIGADVYKNGWDKFGERMNTLGKKVKDAGFQLYYHNHAFEFEVQNGKLGMDLFYETVDPELVKAQFDLAWVQIGGQDPAEYVEKWKSHAKLAHLKDFDASKQPQWQPAGQGSVNWDAVLPALEAAGVEFGGIELDETSLEPIVAVQQSVAYFQSKGLK